MQLNSQSVKRQAAIALLPDVVGGMSGTNEKLLQLTSEQRYQIYTLLKYNHAQTEIASLLGVNTSTISRELKRNTGGRGFRPIQAHKEGSATP